MHETHNAVEIIGFGEEKVHTGILAWLLDTRNRSVSTESRSHLLRALWPEVPVQEITTVTCYREFSGRSRRRIDLVIELGHASSTNSWIVIECKTDSVVNNGQFVQSRDDFRKQHPGAPVHFVALLLGTARFTGSPNDGVIADAWHVVGPSELLLALEAIPERHHIPIVGDWHQALTAELARDESVISNANQAGRLENDEMRRRGYRMPRPVYYQYYHHLRRALDPNGAQGWSIYNGGHNAVLYCGSHTIPFPLDGNEYRIYWEFDDEQFCMKVELPEPSTPSFHKLKSELEQICRSIGIPGHGVQNRPAKETASVYKWNFNFANESIQVIVESVSRILSELPRQIEAALDDRGANP